MNISFTGHRDCQTTEEALEQIHQQYPNAVWVHGGAQGFDSQVEKFAKTHGIETDPIRPHKNHISMYGYKRALLLRDEEIVDSGIMLFVCYDGIRRVGGTYYTWTYADKNDKPYEFLPCRKIESVPCVGLNKPIKERT